MHEDKILLSKKQLQPILWHHFYLKVEVQKKVDFQTLLPTLRLMNYDVLI